MPEPACSLSSVVHSRSTRPQLTTTLSIDHNNRSCQRSPVASLSVVVECCHLWEIRGLENRRPFTRSKGSNPTPSAILSLLSTDDSILVVHSWSIPSGRTPVDQRRTRKSAFNVSDAVRPDSSDHSNRGLSDRCSGLDLVRGLVIRRPPEAETGRARDSNQVVHPHSCSPSEAPPVGFELGPTSESGFAEPFEARSWTVDGPVRPSDTFRRLFLVSPSYSSRS